jgi:hypothetical protein
VPLAAAEPPFAVPAARAVLPLLPAPILGMPSSVGQVSGEVEQELATLRRLLHEALASEARLEQQLRQERGRLASLETEAVMLSMDAGSELIPTTSAMAAAAGGQYAGASALVPGSALLARGEQLRRQLQQQDGTIKGLEADLAQLAASAAQYKARIAQLEREKQQQQRSASALLAQSPAPSPTAAAAAQFGSKLALAAPSAPSSAVSQRSSGVVSTASSTSRPLGDSTRHNALQQQPAARAAVDAGVSKQQALRESQERTLKLFGLPAVAPPARAPAAPVYRDNKENFGTAAAAFTAPAARRPAAAGVGVGGVGGAPAQSAALGLGLGVGLGSMSMSGSATTVRRLDYLEGGSASGENSAASRCASRRVCCFCWLVGFTAPCCAAARAGAPSSGSERKWGLWMESGASSQPGDL